MARENSKVRKRSFGTAMGITSIIAILVILVLVVFSTLSLITSKADLKLSQKTADTIKSYYDADGNAEIILAEFGDLIGSGNDTKIDTPESYSEEFAKAYGYEYNSADNTLKFTMPVDDSRELKVKVQYKQNGEIKEKQLWQVVPANEWKENDSIQLFQP